MYTSMEMERYLAAFPLARCFAPRQLAAFLFGMRGQKRGVVASRGVAGAPHAQRLSCCSWWLVARKVHTVDVRQ